MYSKDILYEVKKSQQSVFGVEIPIRLIGASVSVTIYGSEEKPNSISEMEDIANDASPFIIADWLNFGSLPRFIAFVGTVDDIEVSNCRLVDNGAIS